MRRGASATAAEPNPEGGSSVVRSVPGQPDLLLLHTTLPTGKVGDVSVQRAQTLLLRSASRHAAAAAKGDNAAQPSDARGPAAGQQRDDDGRFEVRPAAPDEVGAGAAASVRGRRLQTQQSAGPRQRRPSASKTRRRSSGAAYDAGGMFGWPIGLSAAPGMPTSEAASKAARLRNAAAELLSGPGSLPGAGSLMQARDSRDMLLRRASGIAHSLADRDGGRDGASPPHSPRRPARQRSSLDLEQQSPTHGADAAPRRRVVRRGSLTDFSAAYKGSWLSSSQRASLAGEEPARVSRQEVQLASKKSGPAPPQQPQERRSPRSAAEGADGKLSSAQVVLEGEGLDGAAAAAGAKGAQGAAALEQTLAVPASLQKRTGAHKWLWAQQVIVDDLGTYRCDAAQAGGGRGHGRCSAHRHRALTGCLLSGAQLVLGPWESLPMSRACVERAGSRACAGSTTWWLCARRARRRGPLAPAARRRARGSPWAAAGCCRCGHRGGRWGPARVHPGGTGGSCLWLEPPLELVVAGGG